MAARPDTRRRALLVGPTSPVGAAFRDATSGGAAALPELGFVAEGAEAGVVIEFAGEPRLVGALEEGDLLDADLVILAAPGAGARQALSAAGRAGRGVLDLAGVDPEPAVVVNMEVNAERLGRPLPRRVRAPHPAAQLITTAAAALAGAARLERLGATVLLPAAEYGREGAEELARQTAAILSFTPPPRATLGHLGAFNVVPSSLRITPADEADRDARLRMECASVLDLPADRVVVRSLAVPVFQATSIVLTVRLDDPAALAGWEARLRERAWRIGPTTPAEIGESSRPHVHALGPEGDGSLSLWIVADGPLAGAAANAARIVGAMLAAAGSPE